MAETTYTYNFEDFLNGSVECGSLHYEIESCSIGSASLVGVSADTELKKCYIVFDDDLSSQDRDVLDRVVAYHAGGDVTFEGVAYIKSEKEFKTNSTRWVRKMSLPLDFVVNGVYKIYFDFKFFASRRRFCHFHILVDNQEVWSVSEKPKDRDEYEFNSGYVFVELGDGPKMISLEVKSDHSNTTVYVGDSTLSIEVFNVS